MLNELRWTKPRMKHGLGKGGPQEHVDRASYGRANSRFPDRSLTFPASIRVSSVFHPWLNRFDSWRHIATLMAEVSIRGQDLLQSLELSSALATRSGSVAIN